MTTMIKIYRITCTKAYMMGEQGTGYSLRPWGDNTPHYEGYDDGGAEYVLPDGYTVAMSRCGLLEIYDPRGHCCTLAPRSDHPLLICARHAQTLARSDNHE